MRELLLKADKEKRSIFKITVLVLLFLAQIYFYRLLQTLT